MAYQKQIISIAFSLFFSLPSFGFTFNNSVGAAFENDEVKINISNQTCGQIGVTHEELLNLVQEAVEDYWNTVHTSRLELSKGAIVATSGSFRTDAICTGSLNPCTPNPALIVGSDILIACNTNGANFVSTSVLAVTVPNNISGDKINGSLILINDNAGNQFANKSRQEKVSILAHEIGHAIGLGHSPVDDSLMFALSIETREALGWDDVDGTTFLYPTEQPFGGCGSITLEGHFPWGGMLIGFILMALLGRPFRLPKLFKRPTL